MVDISEKSVVLPQKTFLDMQSRVNKYISLKSVSPSKVFIFKNGTDWVSYARYLDMRLRFVSFKAKNNGRMPSKIWIKKPTSVKKSIVKIKQWYYSAKYTYHKQNTNYTCGPASIVMLASEFGINVKESDVARWAGTGKAGTGHEGMIKVLKKLGLKPEFVKIDSLTLKQMGEIAEDPRRGIIYHNQVRDKGIAYDYSGNLIYAKYRKGHYTYLDSVDVINKLIKCADPDRTIIIYKEEQVRYSCKATENEKKKPSVLLVKK